jgi:hypothetical protein
MNLWRKDCQDITVTAILGHECAPVLALAQKVQEKLSSELNTIERLLSVQIFFSGVSMKCVRRNRQRCQRMIDVPTSCAGLCKDQMDQTGSKNNPQT